MSIRIVGSLILATSVVAASVWVADRSLGTRLPRPSAAVPESRSAQEPGTSVPQSFTPAQEGRNAPSAASVPSQNPSGIVKCIVNGKTVYSNGSCEGATRQAVAIHDSAGIVSPPKESLAELTAKREASERAYVLRPEIKVTSIGPSSSVECNELDKHIAYLDSVARQPHSPQTADWIREQRRVTRDRQFAIRC